MDSSWTNSSNDVGDALTRHRPELLRHCYRMLGCFSDAEEVVQEVLLKAWRSRETYAADAPVLHWLMRIATNTCLNALTRSGSRGLPQLDHGPMPGDAPLEPLEAAHWVTPAPDAKLLPDPAEAAETREAVAIAFIALLQRLPPRQRAVLLLKDVVGWPAEEIAAALALTVPSVTSALHRARETVATRPRGQVDEPPGDVVRAYVRSWEERDLQALVALLKKDVVFAMPPYTLWLRGAAEVERFLRAPRFTAFWSRRPRAVPTRANGLPAVVWYGLEPDGRYRPHSIQVMRFEGGQVAEATTFIGAPYLVGFELAGEMTFEALTG
jgi:RNA polymerase sigma-70 factor (ECF subfamily)